MEHVDLFVGALWLLLGLSLLGLVASAIFGSRRHASQNNPIPSEPDYEPSSIADHWALFRSANRILQRLVIDLDTRLQRVESRASVEPTIDRTPEQEYPSSPIE